MKKKIILMLISLTLVVFSSGITYSLFHSGSLMSSHNQNIAKFIFNAEVVSSIELPIVDLNPSETKEYLFSVSNNLAGNISNVTVDYQITIKTYLLVPIVIELYSVENETETLEITCDTKDNRNDKNELVCNTTTKSMLHTAEKKDDYKLKIKFVEGYDDASYANLVDFINLEINSWQKIEKEGN